MGPPIPTPVRTGLRTASPDGRQDTATLSLMKASIGPARNGPTLGAGARTPCSDRQEERRAQGRAQRRQGSRSGYPRRGQ
eukprot:4088526-Alexandrium_andersonii.AAC.1